MRLLPLLFPLVAGATLFAQPPVEGLPRVEGLQRLGGPASVRAVGVNAFSYPARVLTARERRAFAVGNAFFKDNWVAAPSSTPGRDGLGPLFNARSCSACHLRDGRSQPPAPGALETSGLLIRLGLATEDGPDRPHPVYGAQLQDRALPGMAPEARLVIEQEVVSGTYADGRPYELLRPIYRLVEPGYGPFGPDLRVGARVAPQLIGMGLLEAIPAAQIVRGADPEDQDGDGISGRAHWVSSLADGSRQLGRFGWKATRASVRDQTADAFRHDIGITSPLFPTESTTPVQEQTLRAPHGGEPELSDLKLNRVTFYTQTLAVPEQRRPRDPLVRQGARLFATLRCNACHVPEWTTGPKAVVAAYSRQTIRPFTDLLLHDMGPALADQKRDGDARPQEWRTPPLWGLGLIEEVNGHTRYLHDGRARNLEEAVLWHGGEAEASRKAFMARPAKDRDALLAFLYSL